MDAASSTASLSLAKGRGSCRTSQLGQHGFPSAWGKGVNCLCAPHCTVMEVTASAAL